LTLAAILAQPAYHEAESTSEAQPKKTWWQLFIEWLAGLFDKLFGGLYSVAVNVPWIGQVIVWVTLTILAVAVIFVATRLARYLMERRRASRDDDSGDLLDQPVPADELAQAAHAAAARGDYALAISLLFRAALRRLDAGGIIDYDAARTAGEYRRAVRRACAPAAPPFDSLAQTFTLATYAERPVGAHDWTAAGDAYERFGPALGTTRRERAA
jgi:HAMP domain-containing protein